MKSNISKSLAPFVALGVASAASIVSVPQQVLAGTISAESRVSFTDVSFTLNGVSLFDQNDTFTTVQAQAEINNVFDNAADGPSACGDTPISVFAEIGPGSVGTPDYASAGAAVDCDGAIVSASNFATLDLTAPPVTDERGSSIGAYTTFDDEFDADAGDVIDFSALLSAFTTATITDYTGGIKVIESEFLLTFQIRDTATNEVIFEAPSIDCNSRVINQNGTDFCEFGDGEDELVAFMFEIPEDGTYNFRFSGTERTSGRIARATTPEPSALLGFLAIGGMGLLSGLRRKSH